MDGLVDLASTLMAGGTMEIVLLIVLILVALVLLVLALWVAWKLLGLLAKGLLWLVDFGGGQIRSRSAAHKEAQRSRPPPVSTGWGRSGRIGLRLALAEARRLTSVNPLRIVVVSGDGGIGDLCRSLSLTPPPVASLGIAAGGETILIDATQASNRELRRLAAALPWSRPVDGVAVIASADGLPQDALARASDFARAAGLRTALHIVLPSRSEVPAWRVVDASNRDGNAICDQLTADAARIWLVNGDRTGLQELALAQARDLPGSIDRAIAVAPSSVVDIASVGFSGAGLRGAVAQTVSRTRPSTTPGMTLGVGYAVLAIGLALATVAATVAVSRSEQLRGAVSIAAREAAVPWTAEEVAAVPNRTRMHRLVGIAQSLNDLSEFSALSPLAWLTLNHGAPKRLGGALLDSYLLRPLGATLERQAKSRLVPSAEADAWLDSVRVISDWTAAWEALADDPREVDVKALVAAGFGGGREEWPDGIDIALVDTEVELPLPGEGGLDVAGITELARNNFDLTMSMWANRVYTNGPVAKAARRASDLSVGWREQHTALLELRAALQDPAQQWLTDAEDRSDHAAELRLLGRALASGLIGQTATIEAKARVASIRIAARKRVGQFILPGLGAILARSSDQSGSNLHLSTDAAAWLRYLDRVANAGFAEPPGRRAEPIRGLVTVDVKSIAEAHERLRTYDRFAADLPADLPAAPARALLAELAAELVLGLTVEVENALRPDNNLGLALTRAERRAGVGAVALEDLVEIEAWLVAEHEHSQADKIRRLRARIADGVLTAAAEALDEEDPLGTHIDPTADSNAMVRRFERGVARLNALHQQYAQPFLPDASVSGESWIALDWRNITDDLAAYARGDADSALSSLEGNIRAWAEDSQAACDSPRSPEGRGDYLARVTSRFQDEIEAACEERERIDREARMAVVRAFFETHVEGLWPFAPDGPELGPAALAQFVEKLHDNQAILSGVEGQLAADLAEHAAFWEPGADGLARFKVEWRWRPGFEALANHVAEIRFEGSDADEAGVHSWRYGETFAIHIRLARNSPYRFRLDDGRLAKEWRIAPGGHGALLRAFAGVQRGEVVFERPVVDESVGREEAMRLTGRLVHEDGRPMTVPKSGLASGG